MAADVPLHVARRVESRNMINDFLSSQVMLMHTPFTMWTNSTCASRKAKNHWEKTFSVEEFELLAMIVTC